MTSESATYPINRKLWLWVALGMTALSVFVFVDLPLLTTVSEHGKHLAQELPVLVPHMICGFIALCIGPLQFSSRLRQGNINRHRLLGKIYVCAIIAGAIGGYLLVWGNYSPFGVSVDVLASLWLITAAIAFIAARKRQITQHRQWMIRSYAVTFFRARSRSVRIPRFSSKRSRQRLFNFNAMHSCDSYSGHCIHLVLPHGSAQVARRHGSG